MTSKPRRRRRPTIEINLDDDWRDDPLGTIEGIGRGISALEAQLREVVQVAREQGSTWDDIGRALGITRQGAWRRFGNE